MVLFDYFLLAAMLGVFASWFNLNRIKNKYGFIDIHEKLLFGLATIFSLMVEGLYLIAWILWVLQNTSNFILDNIGASPEFYNIAELIKSLMFIGLNLFVSVVLSKRSDKVVEKIKMYFEGKFL